MYTFPTVKYTFPTVKYTFPDREEVATRKATSFDDETMTANPRTEEMDHMDKDVSGNEPKDRSFFRSIDNEFKWTDILSPPLAAFKASSRIYEDVTGNETPKQFDPSKAAFESIERLDEFAKAPIKKLIETGSILEGYKEAGRALLGETETEPYSIIEEAAGKISPEAKAAVTNFGIEHPFIGSIINESIDYLGNPVIFASYAKRIQTRLKNVDESGKVYKTLGLKKNASIWDVKKAWKDKVSVLHPDLPSGNAEEFKKVQSAYEKILKENPLMNRLRLDQKGLPSPSTTKKVLKSQRGSIDLPEWKGVKKGDIVKVGKSPQVYTIKEILETSAVEKSLNEQYFEVENKKTGEVEIIEASGLKRMQPKVSDGSETEPTPEIPTKEEVPGIPVKAFRGTKTDSGKFRTRSGIGVHFGTKEQAEFVASTKGGGVVKEVALDIKNPISLEDRNAWGHAPILQQLKEKGIVTEEEYNDYIYGNKSDTFDVTKVLQEKGFDSIVYANTAEGKGDSYLIFDKSQIKEVPQEAVPRIKKDPKRLKTLGSLVLQKGGIDPSTFSAEEWANNEIKKYEKEQEIAALLPSSEIKLLPEKTNLKGKKIKPQTIIQGKTFQLIGEPRGRVKMTRAKAIKRVAEGKKKEEIRLRLDKQKAVFDSKLAKEKDKQLINLRRRDRIRAIKSHFNLTDNEMKSISKKDTRLMTNYEFHKFKEGLEEKAYKLAKTRQRKNELLQLIADKELKKTENVFKLMNLPSITKMNDVQLEQVADYLSDYEYKDEFLSPRLLETIDNTELKNVRTVREVKENLAKKAGKSIEELKNVNVGLTDKFRYDTALSRRNPFYKVLVEEATKAELVSEFRYQKIEKELEPIVKLSRNSRTGKTFTEIAVPMDEKVFNWLNSDSENKKMLAEEMTKEELDFAGFVQYHLIRMRDVLINKGTLKKYRKDYIVHVGRPFLEATAQDGLTKAFAESFEKNQMMEADFNIIDDSGKILPLEKFFRFMLPRTGKIEPTKNVAKAFLTYVQAFEKKQALDSLVPMLDAYTRALSTTKRLTPQGMEMDKKLKTFTNEWINNKKGRTIKTVPGFGQGEKFDILLRIGNSIVTIIDLGLNVPIGLASQVGEQTADWIMLGNEKYAKGIERLLEQKSMKILNENKHFTGKTLTEEFGEVSKDIGDKISTVLFGLFHDANVRANKVFLLASLTNAEYETGKISITRLAQIRVDMGRMRMVNSANSIVGKTSLGRTFMKYKGWALPYVSQTLNNIKTVLKYKDFNSREAQELIRTSIIGAVIGSLILMNDDDPNDRSFFAQIKRKIIREAFSPISSFSPKMWLDARLRSFLSDLGKGFDQLQKLETYKTKKGLKGVQTIKKTLTPRAFKIFTENSEEKNSEENNSEENKSKTNYTFPKYKASIKTNYTFPKYKAG